MSGDASDADLRRLMRETDAVAEIQNTVRQGCPGTFVAEELRGMREGR